MTAASVGKYTLWNILGQIAPIAVAIVAMPLLVHRLGMDRYGFLTLVWVLVGYVGVFDLGVGRAMTRVVAERLGAGDLPGAEANARAALTFLAAMGVVLCIGMLVLSGLILRLLAIRPELQAEALNALRMLAFSLPVVMLTSGYRGYLEARQSFGILNIIRVGMGVLTYGGPLIATAFSPRLESMVGSVLVCRLLANYAHRLACVRSEGADLRFERPSFARVRPLLQLGGWITVSNIISPLMGSMDRLIVAGLVPVAAIGMYATAFDVVSKVLIVAYSLAGATFPVFASLQDRAAVREKYATVNKAMILSVWPVLFVASLFAQTIFTVWMGANFATVAAPALQILAIGLFFNTAAQLPAMMIHSRGQPRWMAMLHMVEVPIFLCAIYLFTKHWGVLGTAAAWALRASIDAIILFAIVERRIAPDALSFATATTAAALAVVLCALPFMEISVALRVPLCVLVLSGFGTASWFWLLDVNERAFLSSILSQRLRKRPA